MPAVSRNSRSLMPTNLYGPQRQFRPQEWPRPARPDPEIPRGQAGRRTVGRRLGTGRPRREFVHVDDLADASLFVMGLPKELYASATQPMLSHVNVGTGRDIFIEELAALSRDIVGYQGRIEFDASFPDGTSRKPLDVSVLKGAGLAGAHSACRRESKPHQ